MRQQIIVSGVGGQGAVTLTRWLGEAAMALGVPVLTSETHGMAQRGGTVISMVKVGGYHGPLVPWGAADVGLFLREDNLAVHGGYLKAAGVAVVNTPNPGPYLGIDALGIALGLGLKPVTANLVLLGYAAGQGVLFCGAEVLGEVIRTHTPARFVEDSLKAFGAGMAAAREGGG
ncbi:MAG: 2-oxoacid:acceptor oxidoreductase family protein [Desulfobaccales bacterium]